MRSKAISPERITQALKTRGVKGILQYQKAWAKAFGHKLAPREWAQTTKSVRGVAACQTCGEQFIVDIYSGAENVGEFSPSHQCSTQMKHRRSPKKDWPPPPRVTVTYCRSCGYPTQAGLSLVHANCTHCNEDDYMGYATYALDVSAPSKATKHGK